MHRKSYIVAAALMLGLSFGVAASPIIGMATASAQTEPPAATPTTSSSDTLRTTFLDRLAAALGIQRSALDVAIINAGNTTIDDGLAQGTLTQAQADALKARIAAGDTSALWSGHGVRGHQTAGLRTAMLDAAAQTLNLTADDLETQLRGGQTVAQLAQTHGTTEQAVVDAALAAAKAKLAEAVSAGTMTSGASRRELRPVGGGRR